MAATVGRRSHSCAPHNQQRQRQGNKTAAAAAGIRCCAAAGCTRPGALCYAAQRQQPRGTDHRQPLAGCGRHLGADAGLREGNVPQLLRKSSWKAAQVAPSARHWAVHSSTLWRLCCCRLGCSGGRRSLCRNAALQDCCAGRRYDAAEVRCAGCCCPIHLHGFRLCRPCRLASCGCRLRLDAAAAAGACKRPGLLLQGVRPHESLAVHPLAAGGQNAICTAGKGAG